MFRIDTATAVGTLPTPATAGTPGYFTNGNPSTGSPATTFSNDWCNTIQEELMSILAAASVSASKTTNNQVLTALGSLFIGASGGQVAHLGIGTAPTGYKLTVAYAGNAQAYFGSTGSNPSTVTLDNAAGGQSVDLLFQDAGVNKWAVFKDADGSFKIQDTVNTKNFLHAVAGGSFYLGAAQNVSIDQSGNISSPGSSITGSGYAKLQNGLILQWGSVTVAASGASSISATTVTFPTTFPTSALAVVPVVNGTNANTSSGGLCICSAGALGASSFSLGLDTNGTMIINKTQQVNYIAVGY